MGRKEREKEKERERENNCEEDIEKK